MLLLEKIIVLCLLSIKCLIDLQGTNTIVSWMVIQDIIKFWLLRRTNIRLHLLILTIFLLAGECLSGCVMLTFQRCMLVIFHELIENIMEVFMDDFSVFGSSYDICLHNLSLVLRRCEETNLVLNWEKWHFIVQ